ncbi:hypothetical protein C0J52_07703 [Blattella germanica]|nr:hypothetical protein C0J52_07703 [Blattella germanica]
MYAIYEIPIPQLFTVLGILLCTLSCSAELNSEMQLSVASFSLDLMKDSDSLESLRFWSYGKMKDFHTFSSTVEDILDKDYISRFNEHQLPYYKEGNISIRTDIALSGEELLVRAVTMRKICPSGNSSELGAKWVHLPLASTRNITLMLVAPTDKHGLQKLIEKLTPEDIVSFMNYSSSPDDWEAMQVTLPPFNINASIDFIPHLRKLGLGDIFGKSSDLSGFSSHQELYVTQAIQTGQFIVDEYGTRTKLYSDFHFPTAFRDLGDDNSTLKNFLLDEPFLFFVVDEINSVPLLMGRVTKPVARNWNPFRERELRMKKLSP